MGTSGNRTQSGMTKEVIATRIFNAPVEQVWKAWNTPEYVMQWWGPQGFTCPIATIDFREGGTSFLCMRAPAEYGGQDLYNTWTYHTIDPYKQIEFILNFTDQNGTKL